MARLKPIGEELVRRGHRVVAAVKGANRVGRLLSASGIAVLDAPVLEARPWIPWPITDGFCQILANAGFDDADWLTTALARWTELFEQVKPSLVIVDHSPTALLALWGRPTPRVNIGSGFFCPPAASPLPIWNSEPRVKLRLLQHEEQLTKNVNRVLEKSGRPMLGELSHLFSQIHATFLTTYPELDHFGERIGQKYWGHWGLESKGVPSWPALPGPRVYAYLKPFPALDDLLGFLRRSNWPTLVVNGGLPPETAGKFESQSLHFVGPLDLNQAAAECDLAVLNANHGTLCSMLRAGKPCLLIPLYMEQLLLARKAEKSGAVTVALSRGAAQIVENLKTMRLVDSLHGRCARSFSERYAHWRSGDKIQDLVDCLERLL